MELFNFELMLPQYPWQDEAALIIYWNSLRIDKPVAMMTPVQHFNMTDRQNYYNRYLYHVRKSVEYKGMRQAGLSCPPPSCQSACELGCRGMRKVLSAWRNRVHLMFLARFAP